MQVTFELEVVRRVREDQINRARGQAVHAFDAIAVKNRI